VSDKAFKGMLKIMKDELPENNELPSRTYEALRYKEHENPIHDYSNDCILYRSREHGNLSLSCVQSAML
jgi:hypothetical protein